MLELFIRIEVKASSSSEALQFQRDNNKNIFEIHRLENLVKSLKTEIHKLKQDNGQKLKEIKIEDNTMSHQIKSLENI